MSRSSHHAEAAGRGLPQRATSHTYRLREKLFALMRSPGLREALAFDGDFAAAGFLELR